MFLICKHEVESAQSERQHSFVSEVVKISVSRNQKHSDTSTFGMFYWL